MSSSTDWLPLWKWQHPEHSNAEITPIYASKDIQRALPGINSDLGRVREINKALSDHDEFNRAVYFLRNKEKPDLVKIGQTQDAMRRISSSQRCRALDFMRSESVQIELIFICLKIPARTVEAQAHFHFGPAESMENGGREWFRATSEEIMNFMKQNILSFDGGVVDHRVARKTGRDLFKACIDHSSGLKFLSDLGRVLRVYRRGNALTVVSSLWFPVRALSSPPHYDLPEDTGLEYERAWGDFIRGLAVIPFDECIDIKVFRGIPEAIDGNLRIDWWDRGFFDYFGHDEVEHINDYDYIYEHVEYSANMILTEAIDVGEGGKVLSYGIDLRDA